MIICPECKEQLNRENYKCKNCSYNADISNNIVSFIKNVPLDYENFSEKWVDKLQKAEGKHFWFLIRREIILYFFNKYIDKSMKILEIGSGTGNIAGMLSDCGYNISIADIHFNALNITEKYTSIKNKYQFDLLKNVFNNEYQVVALFDVLEHFTDDELILKNINEILTSKGRLILTVPAHKWLWNRHDVISGHKRRYEQKTLSDVLEKSGFRVLEINNFFTAIIPFLFLRSLLDKNIIANNEEMDKDLKINPIINSIFLNILKNEISLLKYFHSQVGGSIIALAEKLN